MVFKQWNYGRMHIKWFHHLFLWAFRTRVALDSGVAVLYKMVFGHMFVIDVKEVE